MRSICREARIRALALALAFGCVAIGSLGLCGSAARAAEVTGTIHVDEPGPRISRYLYGHFLEHLGRAVYDGVWVGPDSPIPNRDGLRADVLDALKALEIPVIRWPGGCYADEYHWRTGIGPRDERPVTINMSWGGVEETNAFGTHEFFALAEAIGAEAYIAGNLGTGSAREMVEWLEYMTSPSRSTLAEERRANGRDEPFRVPFFGVGNESWGCGGQMRPAYYADLYRQTAEFLEVRGERLMKIASGGYDARTDWTEELSRIEQNIDGISHHYYTTPTGVWERKGSATASKTISRRRKPCSSGTIRRAASASISTSGARGTTRRPARARSGSRTRFATRSSRRCTSTCFTGMPSACAWRTSRRP